VPTEHSRRLRQVSVLLTEAARRGDEVKRLHGFEGFNARVGPAPRDRPALGRQDRGRILADRNRGPAADLGGAREPGLSCRSKTGCLSCRPRRRPSANDRKKRSKKTIEKNDREHPGLLLARGVRAETLWAPTLTPAAAKRAAPCLRSRQSPRRAPPPWLSGPRARSAKPSSPELRGPGALP